MSRKRRQWVIVWAFVAVVVGGLVLLYVATYEAITFLAR